MMTMMDDSKQKIAMTTAQIKMAVAMVDERIRWAGVVCWWLVGGWLVGGWWVVGGWLVVGWWVVDWWVVC